MRSKSVFITISLSILALVHSASAQDNLDSLKILLKTTPEGPEKSKLYGQISWGYISSAQMDKAFMYADSIKLQGEKLRDSTDIAYAQFYYGVIARLSGEHPKALEHLNFFIDHNTSIGDSIKVSHGLFQLGSIHGRIGNYKKSLKALYRALRIHESQEDQSSVNFALNSIGVVLKTAKRYDEALEVYTRVLLTDSLNTDVLMNMGNLYGEKNDLKEAEVYFLKALDIDQANGNERYIASDLESLGNLYHRMKAYDKSLVYGLRALKIRQTLPYKLEEAFSLKQLGITYLKLENYPLAKQYLRQASVIAANSNARVLSKEINKNLALIHKMEKDFGKAYEYLEMYSVLNDSLLNEENSKQVNELRAKYESEKKDQQITVLAQEKQLQAKETQRQATLKNAFIGGIVLVVLLAILLLYTLRQRHRNQRALAKKNDEIKEVHFKRQLSELEMKALQAQINPHFIFNCMSSINDLILDGSKKNASKYLTKFSKLIRLILENAEETEVTLKNELDMLEAYVQLETLRFEGSISYDLQIDHTLDSENTYLPSMVLQPFVENAIWHGLLHKKESGRGKITISIERQQNQLACAIQDNGIGREKAFELRQKSVWKSKSLGLKITEERLRLLSKELQKQLIRVIDLKDNAGRALGTRVEVNIPIM